MSQNRHLYTTHFEPIKIHNNPLELVKCAKILGLTVSSDLKWNEHVRAADYKKGRKKIAMSNPLKRANAGTKELLHSTSHVSDQLQNMRARYVITA